MTDTAPKPTLLELATNRFDQDILPAEEKLFKAVEKGEQADCEEDSETKGVIRSDRLTWLCTDSDAVSRVMFRGVWICAAEFQGDVDFEWAKIAFPFRAEGCLFKGAVILKNSHMFALSLEGTSLQKGLYAQGVKIEESVYLGDGFEADGGVDLTAAEIGGLLSCQGGRFVTRDEKPALHANGAKIGGGAFLSDAFADGGVDLTAAEIGGQLACDGGKFISKGENPALYAGGAKIGGSVFLNDTFEADGGVNLTSAEIGGQLACNGGKFVSKGKNAALYANGAEIGGSVFLNDTFEADGGVNLTSAEIGGQLNCEDGRFIGQGEKAALEVNGAKIGGDVLLRRGFEAHGKVRFDHAEVVRLFQLWDVRAPEKLTLDLTFAKVGRLLNHQNSWPSKGNLFLGGFVYDQIDDRASANSDVQIRWLELQTPDQFVSQPYEQLASVFRERGLDDDARRVMIEKNKEHGRRLQQPSGNWTISGLVDRVSWVFRWLWYRFLGKALVGYGYRPGRAFGWSLLVIAIGWLVFQAGYNSRLIIPTADKAYIEKNGTRPIKNGRPQISKNYPKFNGFVYSVETFVPFLKLGIGEHWTPNANLSPPYGSWLLCYQWIHIILGWILGTLWIGGLTKVLKT